MKWKMYIVAATFLVLEINPSHSSLILTALMFHWHFIWWGNYHYISQDALLQCSRKHKLRKADKKFKVNFETGAFNADIWILVVFYCNQIAKQLWKYKKNNYCQSHALANGLRLCTLEVCLSSFFWKWKPEVCGEPLTLHRPNIKKLI